jgi:hypothetical protein
MINGENNQINGSYKYYKNQKFTQKIDIQNHIHQKKD